MQKLKEKYFWKSRNTLDTREITTRKYLTVAMKGENCKRKEKPQIQENKPLITEKSAKNIALKM